MIKKAFIIALVIIGSLSMANAQENPLKIKGELSSDQRMLLKNDNDWAWNENRLDLQLEKKVGTKTKFYSEIWLRNLGLPQITSPNDLFNKNIISPYNTDIREAYVQVSDFLIDNLDVKLGKQRIAWGTADKLNPSDNINPYDLEDLLDFGRHNGSIALNMQYYINNDFSIQGIYSPYFQPDNLPVGMFSELLTQNPELPQGLTLAQMNTSLNMPAQNLKDDAVLAAKLKGFAAGFDFSLSYTYTYNGLPVVNNTTIKPIDMLGNVALNVNMDFYREHIFGADIAGSIGNFGVWAEAAAFLPTEEVHQLTDVSALYPSSPVPVIKDSLLLDKKAYVKFVLGTDYHFGDGTYVNLQYLHGFLNEEGKDNLNDYFMLRSEHTFFDEKLKISPLSGAFVVSNWDDVKNNYALMYVPEISYKATDNAEITLGAYIFDGKGGNLFAGLKDYSMATFKLKYSF